MNVLEADSIVVSYDARPVLTNVYINCRQNEIVGLLGRNGCGKSTLLNVMFGIMKPEHYSVRINGAWIRSGYDRSRVVMLPQSDFIPSNVRIREAMRLFKLDISIIEQFAPELIPVLDNRPGQLSGGELRFLELLLILFTPSQFCLLDEPFSGLSPVMIERAIAIMKDVKKDKGLLITDHFHRYVTSCSDRIYCMYQGRVVEITETDDLVRYGYVNSLD